MHYPQAWTTIFATRKDRRSFVKTCLDRSQPLLVEATVEFVNSVEVDAGCKCGRDEDGMLLSTANTCEWHFEFGPLSRPANSKRIKVLNADTTIPPSLRHRHGSFRFLNSSLPQLTTFKWIDERGGDKRLSLDPRSLLNLRSVSFEGHWNRSFTRLKNLTSLSLKDLDSSRDAEEFRLFILQNRTLTSLQLSIRIKGSTKGPPVDLLNLKFLRITRCTKAVAAIFRVPALKHLSSLRISGEAIDATGGGISFYMESPSNCLLEDWRNLTQDSPPTLRHVRADGEPVECMSLDPDSQAMVSTFMRDADTLEIGLYYSGWWNGGLWDELKLLGPQLRTLRLEAIKHVAPLDDTIPSDPYVPKKKGEGFERNRVRPCAIRDNYVFDMVAELAERRLREGYPLSSVERMIVNDDEEENRLLDHVWGWLYHDRGIEKYLAHANNVGTLQA